MSDSPHFCVVVAARPNFIKCAPFIRALGTSTSTVRLTLVHTGQHYDANMSDIFFRELGLPDPDISLGIGSGSHAEQTGRTMMAFEESVIGMKPDVVVLFGDVNATLACALAAIKLHVPVAHVEAGVRSYDRGMPEEINRVVVDAVANILYPPSAGGVSNLRKEGVPEDRIGPTGNLMVDAALRYSPDAIRPEATTCFDIDDFVLVTLHRPSNVDDPEQLRSIVEELQHVSSTKNVLWPVHPRTRSRLQSFGLLSSLECESIHLFPPVGYLENLWLIDNACAVITDSGGLQTEAFSLRTPCVTVRENTEWGETISAGANRLAKPKAISEALSEACASPLGRYSVDGWDGHAAEKIIAHLIETVSKKK